MQLARQMGASSHKVQLMKASFYADDMDEYNMNGDYIDYKMESLLDAAEYDQGPKLHKSFPVFRTQFNKYEETQPPLSFQPVDVEVEGSIMLSSVEMPVAPPVPSVKPQHKTLKCPDKGVVCYNQSLMAKASRCAVDLSLFKGRSFRVGWALDGTLTSLNTHTVVSKMDWSLPLDQLDSLLQGRKASDTSSAIVQRIRILPGEVSSHDFQASIEKHLDIALKHSLFSESESEVCPRVAPRAGVEALHAHSLLAQEDFTHSTVDDVSAFLLTSRQIWELCVALWGNISDLDSHEPNSHHCVMERRNAVSEWLQNTVRDKVYQDLQQDTTGPCKVFTSLTGHFIFEACCLSQRDGDEYGALLLSQLSGGSNVQAMSEQQLTQWVETEADKFIDTDRLKLMMLVAGKPLLHTSDRVINICHGLDWRRAFAIHLWYICSPVASVTDALIRYEAAFSDESESYASPPLPPHSRDMEWESSSGRPIFDVCYHLLKLFSSRSYPLAPLLNPATHTMDPLDHRLSWLLLRTIESLGYTHVSAFSAANIHTMFAAQLEAHGLWHWAVFVLQHIADPHARSSAVLDVLGRHIDLSTDSQEETFLIEKLHIPAQWVYQAKATYATAHFRQHVVLVIPPYSAPGFFGSPAIHQH
ncbi:Nuclear pore complex protein Nup98-Nup96 [Homalodisca vitripennis]|nr:Nuclear pore complex protein Nup98-Nup96 [Homalodisca vitripennis]